MAPKGGKEQITWGFISIVRENFIYSKLLGESLRRVESRSLSRCNTASFLGTGADCCHFCRLSHIIFLSYFHTGGPCCYIKRVISVHLEACCNRDDSRMRGKEEATVSTVDRGPVFILSTGTWNGTLVLMKMRHGSFTVVFGTPGI